MAIYRVTSTTTWRCYSTDELKLQNAYMDSLPWKLAYIVVNENLVQEEDEICFLASRFPLLGVIRDKEIVQKLCGVPGVLLAPIRKNYVFDPKYVVYPEWGLNNAPYNPRKLWGGTSTVELDESNPSLHPKEIVKLISVIWDFEEYASPCRVCANQISKLGGACSLGQMSCHQSFKTKKGESDSKV